MNQNGCIDYLPSSQRRIGALDGLRAIAIILVLLFHATTYLDASTGWVYTFLKTGWNGVYLFFVLSGFLLSSLLFEELKATGDIKVQRFWIRRCFRTWPLYFFLFTLNFVFYDHPLEPSLLNYLTFTQNWYDLKFFVPTWSLAVEEQFYFCLPIFLLVFFKFKQGRYLLPGVTLLIALSWTYRGFTPPSFHTLEVMDSLLVGVWIAASMHQGNRVLEYLIHRPYLCLALGLAIVYLPFSLTSGQLASRLFLKGGQGIGFGFLLLGCLNTPSWLHKILTAKFSVFLATMSYSLYLSHNQTLYWTDKLCQTMGLSGWIELAVYVPIYFTGSLLLASFLYYWIELPALSMRNHPFIKKRFQKTLPSVLSGHFRLPSKPRIQNTIE